MVSHVNNERMCLTGAAAPAGKLLRLYWQPVALAEELAGSRPVKAVRLMGEDLVLFRDEEGGLGLLNPRQIHLRVTNLVFPNAFVIPMSAEMTITQWHVPVDDGSNY